MITPLDYGKLACDAVMNKFRAEELPPKGVFFYHQGVFLSGMEKIYKLCGEDKYFEYIKKYVDSVIDKDGDIVGFVAEKVTETTPDLAKRALQMLDHKMPTILLYELLDKTGDVRYEKAIKTVAESMHFWPVNTIGGYWHMMTQHNQMWLDGAYMAGPLSVMYADRFGDALLRERAIKQILIIDEKMKDSKTGLYFHGWDESKEMPWADKETGLSAEIWGRAVGWYAVAILDILDYIPENHPKIPKLHNIIKDLLKSLVNFQDKKTGMWFEVLDKPEREDNWVESSCTNLFIYSYAKAMRKNIVENNIYKDVLERAYRGIVDSLYYDENKNIVIDNVCIGTCIDEGTYEHYVSREKIKNDLHGVGAFVLMCSEMEIYKNSLR
ncbi:MAG: glycoside hydrolase family 88 protein [Firmicutes bacterium]|nr:glycoside hydrolase family 88 protein [Bacillota bacterium]